MSSFFQHTTKRLVQYLVILFMLASLSACQMLTPKGIKANTETLLNSTHKFNINGKLGVIYTNKYGDTERASAYYAWSQLENQYDIQISGIFGIGQTHIYGNHEQANLTNSEGNYVADSPEELLYKTVRWIAPISELPNWILAKPSKNSSQNSYDDQNRLSSSVTQSITGKQWLIKLYYKDTKKKPYKLKIQELDKEHPTKITLTIDFI